MEPLTRARALEASLRLDSRSACSTSWTIRAGMLSFRCRWFVSRGGELDALEYHVFGIGPAQPRKVGLDHHAIEHLSQPGGGAPEVGNLPVSQVDLEGPDLARAIPGTILVGDGHDAARSVCFDQALDPATKEVEVLRDQVEQGHRLDATGHRHEVG